MAKTRARTTSGKFVGDDPNTPENEAFVEEKPTKKKAAKKSSKKDLPPVGSSDYKRLVLQGVIKE